jgi:alkanesulfonate monooxygenase SsuD/methylene tetrahydromethanopterin reductase-like flavin-dependent oxidoreductase (luciferase family)
MNKECVALYLQDAHPLDEGIELVKYAEEKGFEAVWQAESRLVRDAIVPMAAFAAVTERIKVGSGVINNWTRNIGLLAATFLTLDDLAPDRIICGIGAWWDPLARNVGIDRRKPLLAMRETVEVLRRLLNMERVTFHGEFHHVDGIELDVVHGRREPRHVPIMIGATGEKMMELTGEIADGVVLNYCVPPNTTTKRWSILERGAKKAGRTLDDIDRPQLIVCSVHDDRARPSTGRAAADAVPGPAAAHCQGQRRQARGCSRSSRSWAGRPPTSRCAPPCTTCPTNWCSALPPAARRPRSRPRCASTCRTAPPAPFSTRWATSS